MHADTVLYMKRGRADRQPVLSLPLNDPDAEVKFAAVRQHHVEQAIKAGAPLPEFEVVDGSGPAEKEGK